MSEAAEHAQNSSTSNSKSPAPALPDEVLLLIMKEHEKNENVLQTLCRVNDDFKRVAEELLYHTLLFRHSTKHPSARSSLAAKHVAKLDLDCSEVPRDDCRWLLQNAHNLQWLDVTHRGKAISYPFQDQKVASHYPFEEGEFAAFLKDTSTSTPEASPSVFGKLKTVYIAVKWEKIEDFLFIFHVPTLKDLTLKGFYNIEPFEDTSIIPSSCHIQTLTLYIFTHPEVLPQIMSFMTSLRKINYMFNQYAYAGETPDIVGQFSDWAHPDLSALANSLRLQKDSLEAIHIEDDGCDIGGSEFYYDGMDFCQGLGSFKDFPCLKSIRVPLHGLLGWDESDLAEFLPPQLEFFQTLLGKFSEPFSKLNSVFESLFNVFVSGDGNEIFLEFEDDFPFEAAMVSRSLHRLKQAGTNITLEWRLSSHDP